MDDHLPEKNTLTLFPFNYLSSESRTRALLLDEAGINQPAFSLRVADATCCD